jgi:hypothetical protein
MGPGREGEKLAREAGYSRRGAPALAFDVDQIAIPTKGIALREECFSCDLRRRSKPV